MADWTHNHHRLYYQFVRQFLNQLNFPLVNVVGRKRPERDWPARTLLSYYLIFFPEPLDLNFWLLEQFDCFSYCFGLAFLVYGIAMAVSSAPLGVNNLFLISYFWLVVELSAELSSATLYAIFKFHTGKGGVSAYLFRLVHCHQSLHICPLGA